jgi:hypothetical protein
MPYSNIDSPKKYFEPKTYTGTGSTQSISGLEFSPDFVWIKSRSNASYHSLDDIVRGAGKTLFSNTTDAETTYTDAITSFNSDGWTMGTDATGGSVNISGRTYVGWSWRGSDSSAVSNTSGTITSTVSANTTSGFSIVSWTGNGSNSDQTLGTGLSTALDFVIAKPRDSGGGTDQWLVYVNGVTDAQNNCLLLNSTAALTTGAASGTPNRGSTAGQLKLYAGTSTNQNLNTSGLKYIAYCFHSVKGFSKFGKYTGNGSTNGTFVYTGFKPAFVIIKTSTVSGEFWIMLDNKRNTYNVLNARLFPNASNAEVTANDILDFTSNGFKLRRADSSDNASGQTYIYAAFAENPFVSSKSIPTTAR